MEIERRDVSDDQVHARLRAAVEKREESYLWVPGDTPPFVPALSPVIYGDGRALFALATINQRPLYWVIRGDSDWVCGSDAPGGAGLEFCEMADQILTDLEEHFGNGRCGYSGNSLFWPKKERIENCQCEECADGRLRAKWPMVDDEGGCSWAEWTGQTSLTPCRTRNLGAAISSRPTDAPVIEMIDAEE